MLNTHVVVVCTIIFVIIVFLVSFIWALAIVSKSIVITFVFLILLFSFHRIIFLLLFWVLIRFLLRWNRTSLFWMLSGMSGWIHKVFNIAHVCFGCDVFIWIIYFQFHHFNWLCIWFSLKISCWLILITFLLLLAVRSF